MANLKIKVIGVLREREEIRNVSNNKTNEIVLNRNDDAGGGGGGGGAAARIVSRQMPKMSALDLAGILNCRRRLEWTKEWLRKNQAEFLSKENLMKMIQFRSNETYHLNCFFDITERQFRYLVTKLGPLISSYEPHRKKKSFSAEERIAITLKYLATGEVHSCRNYCFRASKPVILKMISDICLNIYEILKDQFISFPKTDEQWQNVVNSFQRKSRLPNCIGNMTMQQIKFYTSARFEEKMNTASKAPLIFSAIVDSNNNFLYVNLEKTRAHLYNEIYEHSDVKQAIENKILPLPADISKPQNIGSCYYFACDDTMPLKVYLQNSSNSVPTGKNFSAKAARSSMAEYDYDCCMDEASSHAANALVALSNIFPILANPLRIDEQHARKITLGCVALYNFLRKTDRAFTIHTEKINKRANNLDEDCILLANDEEQLEREENTPDVAMTSCFEQLRKQKGDTAAGLAKRQCLIKYIAEHNLMN